MEKDRVIHLTFVLYKITEELSEKEPLRAALREKALNVLSAAVVLAGAALSEKSEQALEQGFLIDIKGLNSCLALLQKLGWLNKEHISVLLAEYNKLEQAAAESGEREVKAKDNIPASLGRPVNSGPKKNTSGTAFWEGLKKPRHKKIVKILQQKGTAQVKDFEEHFPQLTKRTLRRDMNYLVSQGAIKRQGDRSNTYYRLK